MPAIRGSKSKSKTRRRVRDVDQIHADLRSPKHLSDYKDTKAAEDLPGLGKHYCIECAKWFEGEYSLVQHRRGKIHKRRVRQLREQPYSQKEAEAAIGLSTDDGAAARLESAIPFEKLHVGGMGEVEGGEERQAEQVI